MKRTMVILLVLLTLIVGVAILLTFHLTQKEKAKMDHLPEPPSGYRWAAIPELSDEFDGNELDSTKWLNYQPYWEGRVPSAFDPQNVSVHDHVLHLKSTTQIDDLSEVAHPEQDVWVQAACVSSKAAIASYGYYEARIKASQLSMTSSFWFQGKYSEIDVVEQFGASKNNPSHSSWMMMNTHYFLNGWENDQKTPETWLMPGSAAEDYHIYGVWWKDPHTIWFYHNGEKVAEVKPGGPFDEPMYMFFDTEVFTWEGLPSVDSLKDPKKNTMYVDWVRGWRLVEK